MHQTEGQVEVFACGKGSMMCPDGQIVFLHQFGGSYCDLSAARYHPGHYAHTIRDELGTALHLVHRDVKPSNLILNPQGVVTVLDFGISKALTADETRGAVKDTWGYMSPEQASGAEVSARADQYGVAAVLYELAMLQPLFPEKEPRVLRALMEQDEGARRVEAERRFNEDKNCRVFLANPSAGGTGLNLLGYPIGRPELSDTNCTDEYYYSTNWSSVQRSQSEARGHRRGTRVPVRIHDVCVANTIDEEIRKRVFLKRCTAMELADVQDILQAVLGLRL